MLCNEFAYSLNEFKFKKVIVMKNKSSILIYILLTFAMIMISVTSTLALISDSESEKSNILQFEKVSLMGDSENGSHLSLKLDKENVGRRCLRQSSRRLSG